jgi:hypothetical protein
VSRIAAFLPGQGTAFRESAIQHLPICYKPYTAASQNLLYKNNKNRVAVFSMRFLGIFSLLVFLKMPKNRPFSERHYSNSTQKTANRNGPAKNRGCQRKNGRGARRERDGPNAANSRVCQTPFSDRRQRREPAGGRLTGPALFGVCLMDWAD